MNKIGILSDIHLDCNNEYDIQTALINYSNKNNLDYLIIAGDISTEADNIKIFMENFTGKTNTQLKIVLGNHDYWTYYNFSDEKYKYLKSVLKDVLLDNKPLVIGDTCFVGNTGWYDYSLKSAEFTKEECLNKKYKNTLWVDSIRCIWDNKTDIQITNNNIKKLRKQIEANKDKNIYVVTHTVPDIHFLTFKEPYSSWNYSSAFMGSKKIGELKNKYSNIVGFIFGHTHTRYGLVNYNGYEYICSPLGYSKYDWKSKDIIKELNSLITIIEK